MKITINVKTDEVGSNNTLTTSLITWALMKFGLRPTYVGNDRQGHMTLAADEVELSRQFAKMVNQASPHYELVADDGTGPSLKEVQADRNAWRTKHAASEKEIQALKDEVAKLKSSASVTPVVTDTKTEEPTT